MARNSNAVFVPVMGVTGAGKSSFCRLAAGRDDVEVGHDLHSCELHLGISPRMANGLNRRDDP